LQDRTPLTGRSSLALSLPELSLLVIVGWRHMVLQRAWLEQQRSEVEDQQKRVKDLRVWLNRYQRGIDEEQSGPKRLAQ
jgi:hypothetical protein